jgi:hypothetical protein
MRREAERMNRFLLVFAWTLGVAILQAGCGKSVCDKACEKVQSCDPTMPCEGGGNCSGTAKDLANCINAATCATLDHCVFTNTNPDAGGTDASAGD